MRRLRLSKTVQKQNSHEFTAAEMERIHDLVAWLNGSKGSDKCKSIEQLIRLIKDVYKRMPPISFLQWARKDMESGNKPVWRIIKKINTELLRYSICPRCISIKTIGPAVSASLRLSGSKSKQFSPFTWEWWPTKDFAAMAAYQVVTLEENGLLESLLQCAVCHNWFFAARPWQKFCSDRCRGRHYSSTPEGREKRASYMRTYRKGLKRMSEEMKRVSRELP